MTISSPPLSELKGDFQTLLKFFTPILFMALAGNLTPFIEKILFGYVSAETLAASVNVNMIARIFQLIFIYLTSLAQVYVGYWYGAREYHKIGEGIWQLIWLSLFSVLITLPIGLWIGSIYFQQGTIDHLARPYLYTYLGMNFLFPLRATLTGFYLGQGKASWVTYWTMGGEFLQLLLSSILILGIPGWVPSWGLMGGAISHLVVQSALCFFLFIHFLNAKAHPIYETKRWRWQPKLFLDLVKPGLFRMTAQVLQAPSWAAVAYLMTQLGPPYAPVLSIGITLFYFLACIGTGICTSIMTLHAQFIGAKAYDLIKKSMNSGYQLIVVIFIALGIPMLLFSEPTYQLFFPRIVLDPALMGLLPKLIWMCLLTNAVGSILVGALLAFQDTRFLLVTGVWSVIYDLGICAFLSMSILKISPAYFWLMISAGHILTNLIYYQRIRQLHRKRSTSNSDTDASCIF